MIGKSTVKVLSSFTAVNKKTYDPITSKSVSCSVLRGQEYEKQNCNMIKEKTNVYPARGSVVELCINVRSEKTLDITGEYGSTGSTLVCWLRTL